MGVHYDWMDAQLDGERIFGLSNWKGELEGVSRTHEDNQDQDYVWTACVDRRARFCRARSSIRDGQGTSAGS